MKKRNWLTVLIMALLFTIGVLLSACGDNDENGNGNITAGSLIFTANGEEFVRDGFTSLDGWDLSFDHLYINIEDPTAYQVAEAASVIRPLHAGHSHEDIPEGSAHEVLTGSFLIDLVQGTDATEINITEAAIGNYNRLNFNIVQTTSSSQPILPVTSNDVSDWVGYSIVLIGTAVKNGDNLEFTIRLTEEMQYSDCGPNEFVGVVAEGEEGTAEMTFHFDHVFGDEETLGEPDSVNEIALGFDPFAALATGGVLDVTQGDLSNNLSGADYLTFIDALRTIGHSGEAHCHYSAL